MEKKKIDGYSFEIGTFVFYPIGKLGEILGENIYSLYITFNIKEYVQSSKRKTNSLKNWKKYENEKII